MPLRIVADNGEHMLQNKGDLALIQVTVERLLERWPDVHVGVLTFQQRMLRAYSPLAEPIAFGRNSDWPQPDWFDAVAARAGPAVVSRIIGLRSRISAMVRRGPGRARGTTPSTTEAARRRRVTGPDPAAQPVPAAAMSADLVLAIGGGYMADVDRLQVYRTLNLTASRCSESKMHGLGGQFGAAVTVVDLAGDHLEARLREAISAAWHDGPSLWPELPEAARRQNEASRVAFERVCQLVDERR